MKRVAAAESPSRVTKPDKPVASVGVARSVRATSAQIARGLLKLSTVLARRKLHVHAEGSRAALLHRAQRTSATTLDAVDVLAGFDLILEVMRGCASHESCARL